MVLGYTYSVRIYTGVMGFTDIFVFMYLSLCVSIYIYNMYNMKVSIHK